jgi:NhaP-type Na+/H+ or K+/H+ antiporter
MAPFSSEVFLSTLALISAVIIVSALLSGLIERSGLPQVAVFLLMGAAIGPAGLHLLGVGVDSPNLRVVATLSLALVLFTDAVSLDLNELRTHKWLAFLVLGPGTTVSALLTAGAAWLLLGLSPALAIILGAALASTDPVLLRGLLRRPSLPSSVRQALRLESGMNDAIVLPMVLVAIAIASGSHPMTGQAWAGLAIRMLLLSPAAGVLVALAAVAALEAVRRRLGVRRDYESIYSLGVGFAAFAAAEAVHGSGFIAAFAAGLTVSALDTELCDCFLEYGETTAEMALLFAFVLFGTSLIWSGVAVASPLLLLFVAAVFLLRVVAFVPALLPARISWRDRGLIAWFGPRGLSSLLLVLLAVFENVPQSRELLSICCLVVLCSVVLHGLSPMVLLRAGRRKAVAFPAEVADGEGQAELLSSHVREPAVLADPEFVTLSDMDRLTQAGVPVLVVDGRTERTYSDSGMVIPEAIRLHPEHAALDAERQRLPQNAVLGVLCA